MSAVEEVEVITSGFGAQYGNAQSGVVNISMKEGRSDRWRGRAELRGRVPGAKHFGPGVYDESANPYMQLLNTPEKWLGVDESSSGGGRYYSTIGNGYDGKFGGDSVTLAQVAYMLWRYQGRRDWNTSYNSFWDLSGDLSLGGPISENVRLFLAGRNESEWLFLPTAEPDRNTQVMGNLVFDVDRACPCASAAPTRTNGPISSARSAPDSTAGSGISHRDEPGREQTCSWARFVHASAATFYEVKANSSPRTTPTVPRSCLPKVHRD
jgi:hypothetical protein